MKKIMFTDDLTSDVLAGIKNETRRIMKPVSENIDKLKHFSPCREGVNVRKDGSIFCYLGGHFYTPIYNVGEVVAIAQRYSDIPLEKMMSLRKTGRWPLESLLRHSKGWKNKMFVRADLMPNQIQITGIRAELLQDISDESCTREGIVPVKQAIGPDILQTTFYTYHGAKRMFYKPQDAFAELIDRTCGRGTWHDNPFTFVYEFKLVK